MQVTTTASNSSFPSWEGPSNETLPPASPDGTAAPGQALGGASDEKPSNDWLDRLNPRPVFDDDRLVAANGPAIAWMKGRNSAQSNTVTGTSGRDSGLGLKMTKELGAYGVIEGKVTFDAEGNDVSKSLFFSRQVHWPGGRSGVTLGRGYDMGDRSESDVIGDLTAAGLNEDKAKAFAKGAGLRGDEARQFVKDNKATLGTISRESQYKLFNAIYPEYSQAAESNYNRATSKLDQATPWNNLHPAVRDVAVDFVYQQGSLYKSQVQAIIKNDINALQDYIKNDPRTNKYEPGRNRVPYLEKHR